MQAKMSFYLQKMVAGMVAKDDAAVHAMSLIYAEASKQTWGKLKKAT